MNAGILNVNYKVRNVRLVAKKNVLNIKTDTTVITDHSILSPENVSPNISLRSGGITIYILLRKCQCQKCALVQLLVNKIIMRSVKNFRRREWGFSWISGAFTDSTNLAQGCCNDSMEFCTIILNLQYEVSTVHCTDSVKLAQNFVPTV